MTIGFVGFLLVISTSLLFFTGLGVFTRGFLLKKASLEGVVAFSSCEQNWTLTGKPNDVVRDDDYVVGCWLPAKFKRAVIILIDGLRYDFVAADRMPVVSELLSAGDGQRARLYRFVADPPTTTMQRIKALITGGLPTFVEAGRNFASTDVDEDNVIDGLAANGKKVVFMGDDTWMGMLPGRFNRAFPFPSFNVKDLHTVDSGVVEHLLPMLASSNVDDPKPMSKADWDVIVAHFLGVDHCGHTYGPTHPEMAKKLMQMNDIIRLVTESLDEDTVLFVFGDHGMTKTGDHGGDSALEVDSALLVFSRQLRPLIEATTTTTTTSSSQVNQIDFAATFSLLLGIPIPFGNLGTVITELFHSSDVSTALYLNVKQVDRFLRAYATVSDDFSGDMRDIEPLLVEIDVLAEKDGDESSSLLKVKCMSYLNKVQRLCRDTWAKFDLSLIVVGMSIVAAALSVSYQLATRQIRMHLSSSTALSLCVFGVVEMTLTNVTYFQALQWGAPICAAIHVFVVVRYVFEVDSTRKATTRTKKLDWLAVTICLIHAAVNFSNSYVVCEDSVTSFLFLTLLMASATTLRGKLNVSRLVCMSSVLGTAVCVRIQSMFWRCREEQWWCVESAFLSTIQTEEHKSRRLLFAFSSILLMVAATKLLLRRAGNLNGYSWAVLSATYLPVVMCLGTCSYWALLVLTSNRALPNLPNVVFGTGALGMLILFLEPLVIYEAPNAASDGEQVEIVRGRGLIVPQVYRHLRSNWQKHLMSPTTTTSKDVQHPRRPLVVYGLATSFSSTLLIGVTYVLLVMVILTGDSYAAAFLVLLFNVGAVLHCFASSQHNDDDLLEVPWCWVVLFCLLSSLGFYATGHQQTFPSLRWESATVGSGDVDPTSVTGGQFLPALKIITNTFASTIVVGICLPMMVVWRASYRVLFPNSSQTSAVDQRHGSSNQGEFELLDNPVFFDCLLRLFSKYMLVQGVKLLGCMMAAALHRRHLMVWKIFAPRFVYEAANFVVSVPAILVGYLLVLSANRALRRWMNDKEKRQVENQ